MSSPSRFHVVAQLGPDPKRYARVARAVQARLILGVRVVGVVVVAAGLGLLALHSAVSIGVGLAAGGVALLLYPVLAMRQASRRLGALVNGPWTYVLSDQGVTARGSVVTTELPWTSVAAVRETATDIILLVSPTNFMAIPRAALHPAAADELRAFLHTRGLLR
jgi:hypothetical protein